MTNSARLATKLKKENLPQSLAKKLIKNLIATSCSQWEYYEVNYKKAKRLFNKNYPKFWVMTTTIEGGKQMRFM
jgi:hypothetical protein